MRVYKWSVYLPAIAFPMAAVLIGLRNIITFQAPSIIAHHPFLSLLFLVSPVVILIASQKSQSLRKNAPGLLLLFLFSGGYFLIASIINRSDVNTNNIYFASDSWSWLQRIIVESGKFPSVRAVHPLAMIIFRPLVSLLSIATGGDRFGASLMLTAFTGGGCVFLSWKIFGLISNNQEYAILFASLLGLSASHLIFASTIESYIFSAFSLLLFIWLLIAKHPNYHLIFTGVAILGITITNLVQPAIAFLFIRRNFKLTVAIFVSAILIGMGLNLVSHNLYDVGLFFHPQELILEKKFIKGTSLERAVLAAENLLIYNIASPQPYLSFRKEMPRFNFLDGTIREYIWFGWPALILWIITLGISFYFFFKNIRVPSSHKNLSISMLFCLIFNFILHIRYGTEPFLYSANWTYALIIFTAISLNQLIKYTHIKVVLFALVTSIFLNNLWLIYLITRRVSEYIA